MRRWLITLIIILISASPLFSQDSTSRKDSLLNILYHSKPDTVRMKTLYELARINQTSPVCMYYLNRLLKEATEQKHKKYECLALYAHVIYYYNQQDEKNVVGWMNKLESIALKNKCYDLYFSGKRAEITMYIINRKIEYSITAAERMYEEARKINNAEGMSAAKLCIMTAYMMTSRYDEGIKIGYEAYSLLPATTPVDHRIGILQELILSGSSANDKKLLQHLAEYRSLLEQLTQQSSGEETFADKYLILESLYAGYYLRSQQISQAEKHLKAMDKYFPAAQFTTCRGLYYEAYSNYYRTTKQFDKSLTYTDSAIHLLSAVSENGGLNLRLKRASILTDAGKTDEALPLYPKLLAQKDSLYRELSASQMDELYQMYNIDKLLLDKEQHKTIIHFISLAIIILALITLIPFTIRMLYSHRKLKKNELENQEMNRIAEETNELKDHFLANMSYNIRVPLNNVVGFSQIISTDAEVDDSQRQEFSSIIQSNTAELIQMVNDVLDLSRLEAQKMKFQMQDYDIIAFCSDILNMVRMKSENRTQIDFCTTIENQSVTMDLSRLSQAVLSMVYSEEAAEERKVTLSLNRDEEKKLLVFCISNSPLADPALRTQKSDIRHEINRLLIRYFGGTYHSTASTPPTITFTYPFG